MSAGVDAPASAREQLARPYDVAAKLELVSQPGERSQPWLDLVGMRRCRQGLVVATELGQRVDADRQRLRVVRVDLERVVSGGECLGELVARCGERGKAGEGRVVLGGLDAARSGEDRLGLGVERRVAPDPGLLDVGESELRPAAGILRLAAQMSLQDVDLARDRRRGEQGHVLVGRRRGRRRGVVGEEDRGTHGQPDGEETDGEREAGAAKVRGWHRGVLTGWVACPAGEAEGAGRADDCFRGVRRGRYADGGGRSAARRGWRARRARPRRRTASVRPPRR